MQTNNRMIAALEKGWGFMFLQFNNEPSQRHSLYVQRPKIDGWCCYKVNADEFNRSNFVDALLDEAGVPK